MSETQCTADFWAGSFGDEYTKRNRVDWIKRIPFWRDIVAMTGARTILEVGCNAGYNLSALRMVSPMYVMPWGVEINQSAAMQASNLGFCISPEIVHGTTYNIVFTVGVLIHIAPQDLKKFMQAIIDASAKYVLAVEYFAEKEEEIEYRGHAGKLWKRNYGKLYEDMGLTCIETGFLDKDAGFDNCHFWLMSR